MPEEADSAWTRSVSDDPHLRVLNSLIWLGLALATAAASFVPWLMLPFFPTKTAGRRIATVAPWALFVAYVFNMHALRQLARQRIEAKHARRLGIVWRAAR